MDAISPCSCICQTHSSKDKDKIIKELEERLANNHKVLLKQLDKSTSLSIQLDNSKEKVNKITLEKEKLTLKIVDLTKELNQTQIELSTSKADNDFLQNKRSTLYRKIKDLEDLLAIKGKTEQTIFLNQPKDTRFYNSKEGLGLSNPCNLKKVNCAQLYDINYMGLGLTKLMSFLSVKETNDEEDAKRANLGTEIPFDYAALNESYERKEPPLTPPEEIPTFYPAKETVQDQ
ncbi:unnamed protein product [Cuscuta europaea]|uniref:Uncharacterized protein n=1 Tax=Cuscuta europaea TaxID=41803 RepID=A0A9P0ZYU3_CUSEU|nr:unnamed protein product [Cuscuta europaea]